MEFRRARPAQVYPGIMPMLPTPGHPSYPSNHATQAKTVAELLKLAFPDVPGPGEDDTRAPTHVGKIMGEYLDELADRIGANREKAGLHYRTDTLAGNMLGAKLAATLIAKSKIVQDLVNLASSELGSMFETNASEPEALKGKPNASTPQ